MGSTPTQSIFISWLTMALNFLVAKIASTNSRTALLLPLLEYYLKCKKVPWNKDIQIHTQVSSVLYCLRCSFSADPFPFHFIDYDRNTKSNEGSLEHFNSKCHWANGTPSSSDWVTWHPSYSKKYD